MLHYARSQGFFAIAECNTASPHVLCRHFLFVRKLLLSNELESTQFV